MNLIPTQNLHKLLADVYVQRPYVCFRFRLKGELWQNNFCKVVVVSDKGVTVHDETTDEFLTLRDLTQVLQFEIDLPYRAFRPYHHYEVIS